MGNHQPQVQAGGTSFWRRLRLIPFLHTVPEGKRNPNLARDWYVTRARPSWHGSSRAPARCSPTGGTPPTRSTRPPPITATTPSPALNGSLTRSARRVAPTRRAPRPYRPLIRTGRCTTGSPCSACKNSGSTCARRVSPARAGTGTARVTTSRCLDKQLADGAEWDDAELVTLGLIEAAADRIDASRRIRGGNEPPEPVGAQGSDARCGAAPNRGRHREADCIAGPEHGAGKEREARCGG